MEVELYKELERKERALGRAREKERELGRARERREES